MFYRQRYYHTHSLLFILSLLAAFILGRKSHEYGYNIISCGSRSSNSGKNNTKVKDTDKEKDQDTGTDSLNDLTVGGSYSG